MPDDGSVLLLINKVFLPKSINKVVLHEDNATRA